MSSSHSMADVSDAQQGLHEFNENASGDIIVSHSGAFEDDVAVDNDNKEDDSGQNSHGDDARKTSLLDYGDDLAPLSPVYELGHISARRNPAPNLTFSNSSQDTYYTDLVASRCKGDNLPSIYARKNYPNDMSNRQEPVDPADLYDSTNRNDMITIDRVKRSDGITLSMRKLRDILSAHYREQVRREYIDMLRTGTTSESTDQYQPLGQESEIIELINEQEHQLMAARIEHYKVIHPPTRAPTKQSVASVSTTLDEEDQTQEDARDQKIKRYKDIFRPGPVQFMAPTSVSSGYEQYDNSRKRDRKYGKVDFPRRLLAALVASGSLVIPMLIMSIRPSSRKSLIVSSCFVLAFALGAAWKSSMKPETVLTATAAYTAVLVVFVGANTS
ncbi:MAG: hypothetical protein Q9227_005287 [Pyrenula ochraceoflavens]